MLAPCPGPTLQQPGDPLAEGVVRQCAVLSDRLEGKPGREQLAPLGLLHDQRCEVRRVGDRRDDRGQFVKSTRAALDPIEQATTAKLGLDHEHGGRLPPLGERERRLVDLRVRLAVEVFAPQSFIRDCVDRGRARLCARRAREHDRPEDVLLGGEVLRGDRLDHHAQQRGSSRGAGERTPATDRSDRLPAG